MASSTPKQQQQQPSNMYGATAAPPPTPSTQPNNLLYTSDAADALSRILHRFPPALSLPTRCSSAVTCPPVVSISDQNHTLLDDVLTASSQLGFFQLTDHSIHSRLARLAESESLALFDLPDDKKESYFPKNWPLGYEGADEEDGDGLGESFRLESSCSAELSLDSLLEFTGALEKLGLRIIELLSKAVGFENPIEEDPTRFHSLMWISEALPGNKPIMAGGFYPYIVCMQYQISYQKYSLLADSGWVSVLPQVDSVMVTLGDIAHVWSNGKLKKVRGRAMAHLGDANNKKNNNNSRCISMSLLLTLPGDSKVSSLLPKPIGGNDQEKDEQKIQTDGSTCREHEQEERSKFNSFCFEDYAWRAYHERLLFKDPLDRYRI
ncbi:gibberellin 2-beta-dioxygenase 8 [Juglans microcarpa x Juglans regia]|uniref:gibberellin 2-beta-dioxygenase 8 n=1 Tax=Juglans microcarpa x Juglans regia TaxID=2249226 RepID=UPI001B7E7010|nr:gibberellin 2-beta-dioxygenase 8 [Juglans microcarpa x Juglans regia]